jgi:predicted lipid-binding transport protein (Tim44 family)
MSPGLDPLNILLLAVAAIVAWRLWSVLGTRTGLEKPPIVLQPAPEKPKSKEVETPVLGFPADAETSKPVWHGVAPEGSDLARGLEAILGKSKDFTVASFLQGATGAYEMVLEAFAAPDKATLKNLLSKELLENFSSAIDARNAQGHSMKFQFVGVKSAELKRAAVVGNKAQIDVGFTSNMISATQDKSGSLVDGDEKSIRTVTDLWTFERDVTSRDPNWKLVATDDNE